jgi:cation:H+ antiporter
VVLTHALALVGGLGVLALLADVFVVGAARLATLLGVPTVVVGSLVVGFGTGLPELSTSAVAAGHGSIGIAAGSVIGSDTMNATLVIGVAGLIATHVVSPRVLRREVPLAVGAVGLFALLTIGGLSRLDGVILLGALAGSIAWLLKGTRGGRGAGPRVETDRDVRSFESAVLDVEAAHRPPPAPGPQERPFARALLRTTFGLAGTLGGAAVLVWGALGLARETGVSEGVLGVTLVALGTSLPELVAAIQSARRGHTDLVLGNVLGSNLFNALCVGGIAALISPGRLPGNLTQLPLAMMVATTSALGLALLRGRQLRRVEAVALIVAYAAIVAIELA